MMVFSFFFFNDTATTEIYTLSLHDALPIYDLALPFALVKRGWRAVSAPAAHATEKMVPSLEGEWARKRRMMAQDRKSTRLNSSHANISYAVFCLKKKKKT